MSTRNFPGGEGRRARKADNLTVICEPIIYKIWKPQRLITYVPPRPVTGIALPLRYLDERMNIYNGYEKIALIKRDNLSQNPQDDDTSRNLNSGNISSCMQEFAEFKF
jgi:hypothetical protein